MLQVLTPVFDPAFSTHSYGYRPGRSAHDAVRAAQEYIQAGHTWTVDVDISAFFDAMDHDSLMRQVSAKVKDKRVLRLLGDYLRAPFTSMAGWRNGREGHPRAGPLHLPQ